MEAWERGASWEAAWSPWARRKAGDKRLNGKRVSVEECRVCRVWPRKAATEASPPVGKVIPGVWRSVVIVGEFWLPTWLAKEPLLENSSASLQSLQGFCALLRGTEALGRPRNNTQPFRSAACQLMEAEYGSCCDGLCSACVRRGTTRLRSLDSVSNG